MFWCCRVSEINQMRKNPLKSSKSNVNESSKYDNSESLTSIARSNSMKTGMSKQKQQTEDIMRYGDIKIAAEVYTFRELASATDNFNPELLVGEGGFGRVYKGHIKRTNQAKPIFTDRQRFTTLADPKLEGNYPPKGMYQALALAAMCIQDEANIRPLIGDVVSALEYLATPSEDFNGTADVDDSNCLFIPQGASTS
nr:serine/threonine-protein kinase CDL1-like [Ipomoea batatas]GMC87929.1 serine/threonine-protein kinase CDL1-like [Ipomoea batatas]GMC89835.1 serine/threonine-protein kinase CDL1-like [Ipomoea batatas]